MATKPLEEAGWSVGEGSDRPSDRTNGRPSDRLNDRPGRQAQGQETIKAKRAREFGWLANFKFGATRIRRRQTLTRLQCAPAGHIGHPANKGRVLLGQANGLDVVLVGGGPFEFEHGNVVAVSLRGKPEVWMEKNLDHREDFVRDALNVRVQNVVAERNFDARRRVLRSGLARRAEKELRKVICSGRPTDNSCPAFDRSFVQSVGRSFS